MPVTRALIDLPPVPVEGRIRPLIRFTGGKCVSGETEVICGITGRLVRIDNAADVQHVVSWGAGVQSARVHTWTHAGTKPCVAIRLRSGRHISVSTDHLLLTPDGWRRADQIVAADSIATAACTPEPRAAAELPMAAVDLLAIMFADGSMTGHHVSFSKVDAMIVRRGKAAARHFHVALARRDRNVHAFTCHRGQRNPVYAFLRQHGLFGVLSKNKTIPDAVFSLPQRGLRRFLSTLWMCDGYVDHHGPGITLASERAVCQIQHLLLRVGAQSYVRHRRARTQHGREFDAWTLYIYSQYWHEFARATRLWGRRAQRLQSLLAAHGRRRKTSAGNLRLTPRLVQRLRAIVAASPRRWLDIGRALGWRTAFSCRNLGVRGRVSVRTLQAFCSVFQCHDEFKWLWSDLFWDEAVKVADVGRRAVFDVCVPATRTFVGGGVVLHNSWLVPVLRGGIRRHLAQTRGRYIEPFFGGGAVGLFIGWPDTIACDVSPGIVGMHHAAVAWPDDVAAACWAVVSDYRGTDTAKAPADGYYGARAEYNRGKWTTALGRSERCRRAALQLYLCARGYNGLWRTNRQGAWNVPEGRTAAGTPMFSPMPTLEDLERLSAVARDWSWIHSDFASTVAESRAGDVLFVDPPYADLDTARVSKMFTGYGPNGFVGTDHIRLADGLAAARERGSVVIHTNSDTAAIRALYRERGFALLPTAEGRSVNRQGSGRARVGCLLVLSHPEIIEAIEDGGDPVVRRDGDRQLALFVEGRRGSTRRAGRDSVTRPLT